MLWIVLCQIPTLFLETSSILVVYRNDHGQTREVCEKQEKYFQGKVVTFTVQSVILYQYPVDLLTFFELY